MRVEHRAQPVKLWKVFVFAALGGMAGAVAAILMVFFV